MAYWYLSQQEEAPTNEARISVVEIGSIENTIAAAGSLQPSEYVDVGAQVSGQLQRLYVDVGDVVEEGQLLAEIDARVQEARVEASRASIEALEAQLTAREAALELARSNAERQARLMTAEATSQLEYDNAMNTLASAESSLIQLEKQIAQNRATLETSETELEYTRIYAPMSGTVVSVLLEEGRTLNATQQAPTILRIADLGTMTVEADISEADIGDIKAGMDVYFTTLGGGDRRWYSTVRQILPTPVIENNVVLYTGLFDISNDDNALLPEMTAQVYFITDSAQDVLTIPMGAVTFIERPDQGNAAQANNGAADTESTMARPAGPPGQGPGAGLRASAGTASVNGEESARSRPGLQRQGALGRMERPDADGSSPRPALVSVVDEQGNQQTRRVLIGVTSRITAEVVNGLEEGEQVVSGVIQAQRPAANAAGERRPGGFGGPF
jgi:macrolide-specific efflux system membrane fusion protein